eukprot:2425983-Rhodomonas_salina.2
MRPRARALTLTHSIERCCAVQQVQKGATWQAGFNPRFAGMTMAEIKTLMGARKQPEETKAPFLKEYDAAEAGKLPANFDARANWPQCPSIAHIRDQSTCGSCWAFGAVEAMSDRYPYVFPPCEHHTNGSHYQPCGASKPTPMCVASKEAGARYHGSS